MKLALIFTNDWELFGDGSGDFFEVQHKPLSELLTAFDNHGAKLTVMAEVLQQIKHKEYSQVNPDFKHITEEWDKIIQQTVRLGHDVQLHLHPQWIDAVYNDNKWSVDFNKWKIASLSPDKIQSIIKSGKDYLEDLIRQVKPVYECSSFRAGNYCIQPETEAIKALQKNNFRADTSVTKGFFSDNLYDFRHCPSVAVPWQTDEKNLLQNGNSGIIEFPIYSAKAPDYPALKKLFPKLYHKIKFSAEFSDQDMKWQNERDKVKAIRYPVENRFYKKGKKNFKKYLNAAISFNSIQLDYDYLPAASFVSIINKAFKNKEFKSFHNTGTIIPIIASGHVKDMHNTENINRILDLITNKFRDSIIYWTLSDAVNYWSPAILERN